MSNIRVSLETVQERVQQIRKRAKDLTERTKKRASPAQKESIVLPSEEPEDDDDTDSEDPQELTVFQSVENIHYLEEITLAKLARLGFRHYIWETKMDSYFVFLSFLGGYDIMNSFVFNMNKFGSAFCLMYILTVFLVGFPLFYMEMALGQYSSYSAYNVFERISPVMKGVGLLALILNFLVIVTDQTIVPYFMTLLVNTGNIFGDGLPWHNCFNSYNDDDCRELYHTCDTLDAEQREVRLDIAERLGLRYSQMGSLCQRSRLLLEKLDNYSDWQISELHDKPLHEWFASEALGQHLFWNIKFTQKTIRYLTWPTYDFILYVFLSWTAVYLIYQTGKHVIGKLVKFTTIFTVAVLLTFLFVFFSHSTSGGTRFLSRITTITFNEPKHMFMAAIIMTISSLKLGQGGVIYLGSRYPFQNSLGKDCLIIVLASTLIPFIYAICHTFSLDSYLMELMGYDKQKFDQLSIIALGTFFYSSGNRVFNFLGFVQALRRWQEKESSLICFFSAMGVLLTIMNKVVRLDILITAIQDIFPIFTERNDRQLILHLLICMAFLGMFYFVSADGLENLIGIEGLTIPFVAIFVVLVEVITVTYIYGGRRFLVNIMAMDDKRNQLYESRWSNLPTKLFALAMWCVVIPILLMISLLYVILAESQDIFMVFSSFPVVFGVALASIVPFTAIIKLMDAYRRSGNLKLVFQPDPYLWSPRSVDDRLYAEMLERKYRVS